ncbi:DUF1996 domain-containing protein [Paractinoplanes abujensis]|uniref:DUF1996 domain-containing protein n=1 Tax=Paractinoplanes abujensis TaxID=882441 RepID=A0A7W7CMU6_9ACTN|nr:DUF1996 domain-containing protein [Actinoplanes abujensis]MBB4691423.1 hypothetical protein [Actinoplanes abujensis]
MSMGRVAVALEGVLVAAVVLAAAVIPALRGPDLGPYSISMDQAGPVAAAPPASAGASTGSYTWNCGRNERGHRNTANIVVTPKRPGPPHHLHDYIGNLGVQADSTVDSLLGQPTTCTNGDASSYYWPVLRLVEPGQDGHGGPVQVPVSLTMTYRGNPRGPVLAMPRLLRVQVGDAYAHTNGGKLARAWWTCSDTPDRMTMDYPACEDGAQVVRIFDFPSCWDGRQLDSPGHRQQVVFPAEGGGCPVGTFAVPQLRITMTYAVPPGTRYQIDAFDGQDNSPRTDHGFLVNLMPDAVMKRVVNCLNKGEQCDETTTRRAAS